MARYYLVACPNCGNKFLTEARYAYRRCPYCGFRVEVAANKVRGLNKLTARVRRRRK